MPLYFACALNTVLDIKNHLVVFLHHLYIALEFTLLLILNPTMNHPPYSNDCTCDRDLLNNGLILQFGRISVRTNESKIFISCENEFRFKLPTFKGNKVLYQ